MTCSFPDCSKPCAQCATVRSQFDRYAEMIVHAAHVTMFPPERKTDADCVASAITSKLDTLQRKITHLERILLGKGYRESCDIPACNCGDNWSHGGHANDRLREISEALAEISGGTLVVKIEALKSDRDSALEKKPDQSWNPGPVPTPT